MEKRKSDVVRVAAVGDLHCSRASAGRLQALFAGVAEEADVLALCGDLTDYGHPDEVQLLVRELHYVGHLPVVAVLGNHDFESGHANEIAAMLADAGVVVLDGEARELCGVGFAGVKGFAGGFGRATLGGWGEPAIKHFVQEAIDEALKLESALARLRTPQRIVIMHYAPIAETVRGEALELYPYLGSGRLEEPINRYPVTMVFHGHAHFGSPEGRTGRGVPVYNVSVPVLQRAFPNRPPFRVVEIPREP